MSNETNKQYGHPDFYKLLEQMAELHSRKNHDYAGTSDPLKNLRACTRLQLDPFIGVMVRLQDKWSRIEEFVKGGTLLVKNESVEDTLMDNAVYSLLAIILLREQKKVVDDLITSYSKETESIADAAVIEESIAESVDKDEPRFKAGDTVRIILRNEVTGILKNICEAAKYKGIYVGPTGKVHIINIDDGHKLFYSDEIFSVEGN